MLPNGTLAPCGPGNEECMMPFQNAPQYHIRGRSCGLNDPNAPVYDPVHKVYHLFYQDHMHLSNGPNGVVWAHVASRDLVHWARLPVALWNDRPFDHTAVYTGSATVVDGAVTIIYPGVCHGGDQHFCTPRSSGYNLVKAVPADYETDPLLRNWTKVGVIRNDSAKDPSTAWQTPDGEWRIVTGGTDQDHAPHVYASMDFKEWYEIGIQVRVTHSLCESLTESLALPASRPNTRTVTGGRPGIYLQYTH
jgi:beta-fructofuranosidase